MINWIELFIGFALGITASVIASVVLLRAERISKKNESRRKWERYKGTYAGYGYDQGSDSIINPSPQSEAKIYYKIDNKLEISLSHDSREWSGLIIMDFENYGSIIWHYKPIQEHEHNFGFKRCILKEDNEKFCIYLIGEPLVDNCAKEILIKTKDT